MKSLLFIIVVGAPVEIQELNLSPKVVVEKYYQAQSDNATIVDHMLMFGLLGFQATDGIISAYGFGARTLNEVNPILRPFQNKPVIFAFVKVVTYTSVSVTLYFLHKKNPRQVRYVLIGLTALQAYVTIRNAREILR